MPIDCVETQVCHSTLKPVCKWRLAVFQNRIKGLFPVNVFCFLSPKSMGILNGLGVNSFVGHDLPKKYLNGFGTTTA
jgi:hypothetical protein